MFRDTYDPPSENAKYQLSTRNRFKKVSQAKKEGKIIMPDSFFMNNPRNRVQLKSISNDVTGNQWPDYTH